MRIRYVDPEQLEVHGRSDVRKQSHYTAKQRWFFFGIRTWCQTCGWPVGYCLCELDTLLERMAVK